MTIKNMNTQRACWRKLSLW